MEIRIRINGDTVEYTYVRKNARGAKIVDGSRSISKRRDEPLTDADVLELVPAKYHQRLRGRSTDGTE